METDTKNYCTLYLVRHGETEWNVKNILQGHLDSPLTETGIAQVGARAAELKDVHFDAIFSSDLPRAVESAEIIKLEREILVQTSTLLRERNHGSFEGMNIDEYHTQLKDKMTKRDALVNEERWGFKLADDIETDEELATRLILQMREIALAYPNKTVAVVTHGGCLHIFLLKLGYATRAEITPWSIDNAACIKVRSDGVDFFIEETWGVKKNSEH